MGQNATWSSRVLLKSSSCGPCAHFRAHSWTQIVAASAWCALFCVSEVTDCSIRARALLVFPTSQSVVPSHHVLCLCLYVDIQRLSSHMSLILAPRGPQIIRQCSFLPVLSVPVLASSLSMVVDVVSVQAGGEKKQLTTTLQEGLCSTLGVADSRGFHSVLLDVFCHITHPVCGGFVRLHKTFGSATIINSAIFVALTESRCTSRVSIVRTRKRSNLREDGVLRFRASAKYLPRIEAAPTNRERQTSPTREAQQGEHDAKQVQSTREKRLNMSACWEPLMKVKRAPMKMVETSCTTIITKHADTWPFAQSKRH